MRKGKGWDRFRMRNKVWDGLRQNIGMGRGWGNKKKETPNPIRVSLLFYNGS